MENWVVVVINCEMLQIESIVGPFTSFENAENYKGTAEECGLTELTYVIRKLEPTND